MSVMVVITLTDCPISLRGDLSKWLIEINTGVFVGRVSARVRDNLWERVKECVKNGRATMVYNTNNEQRMAFRLHNSENEIVDYDGLKLVMKPCKHKHSSADEQRHGFSNAAKYRMGRKKRNITAEPERSSSGESVEVSLETSARAPSEYVVVDIETTGLREQVDDIIEIGLLHVIDGVVQRNYQALVKPKHPIPRFIEKMTGISDNLLNKEGKNLEEIMSSVLEFIGQHTLVGYNIMFDIKFINKALERAGHEKLNNITYDVMAMYADYYGKKDKRKSLEVVVEELSIEAKPCHRALQDCIACQAVYEFIRNRKNLQV